MTDAMPLDEPIQEPAPGKIERLDPSGATTQQNFKAGFNMVEENSVETPRPLMREVPPAEPFPVDVLGGVLRSAAEAIHDRTQAPMAICAQSVLAAATLAVQGHADVELPTPRPHSARLGFLRHGRRDRREEIGLRPAGSGRGSPRRNPAYCP